ncbi:ribosome-associated Tef1p biogenesis chaperone CHP1 [Ascoidea rubescens DSM 1968]|uniref:Protein PBDC1 homolog n=1 Tax=Ascoidea rubescens DSM 1968 TaxID=1344418 RepID=A0A1D2VPW3_9ASCO|nr:DUF757-domain-containing protein [Ascoidea rubescens DSM 1968]ODV63624.1 DUF757-domain-containing protein [Ascoidea rubescens DSM 1968]
MSTSTFNAEEADNFEDIEKQFAVKAVQQAETFWNLLSKVKGSKLRLTKYDDFIYEELIKEFPEFSDPKYVAVISEDDLKNHKSKEKWRNFVKIFEEKIKDYNFGTLLRSDCKTEYDQHGTIFVLRIQFYCIEICRNRYELNDWISEKK